MHRRTLVLVLGLVAAILMAVVPAGAAPQAPVTLQGKILWISGQAMAIAPVDRPAVTVDLSRLDLSDYAGLMSGDWVVVSGTAPLGSNRVLATSLQRLSM